MDMGEEVGGEVGREVDLWTPLELKKTLQPLAQACGSQGGWVTAE